MLHRSIFSLVAGFLIICAGFAHATNYEISTRDDVIQVDGLCSIREALLAVNTARGHIGGVFTDTSGISLGSSTGQLTYTKKVRNVTRSSQLVTAGQRVVASREDVIEYRISVTAVLGHGDATEVMLGYVFPDQNSLLAGYRGYISEYQPESTTLNGGAVEDVSGGGFPLASSGLLINSPQGVAEGSPEAEPGVIREGESAQIVFRIVVRQGENEVPIEDIPGLEDEEDREYFVEAECPAGTLGNTIFLESVLLDSDDDPAEYILSLGELQVGGGQDLAGANVNPSVVVQPRKFNVFDNSDKKNVTITAASGSRVFRVESGASLSLASITLKAPPANDLGPGGNGGLILSSGSLGLSTRTRLSDGVAEKGGAIFLTGNNSLSLTDVIVDGNTATIDGGGIATENDFSGVITANDFSFYNNSAAASGGAVYFDYQGVNARPGIRLTNGTFYGNAAVDGGAIRINAARRQFEMNNVTIAGNDGGPALSLSVIEPTLQDVLLNSAVLGNEGVGCAADDGPGGPTLDAAVVEYVVSLNESCGPQDIQYFSDDPGEVIDYSQASFGLLVGMDPASTGSDKYVCGSNGLSGSAGCLPRDFGNGFVGFLPNNRVRAFGEPAVYSFGSPEDAVGLNVCESTDQRGLDRLPRCDVGAVELQIAAGKRDEFTVVQQQRSVVDVVTNDLGDLDIDCTSLATPTDCVTFVLLPSRGAVDVVIGDGVEVDANGDLIPFGFPMVHYTSVAGFHGVDQFRYVINKQAIDGVTYADENPSSSANVLVEPAEGLTSKENISTLSGGVSIYAIAGMLALFWRRRSRAISVLSGLLLVLLSPLVQAAEIRVNTLVDSDISGDGLCSLREALRASVDNSPFFVPDCQPGSTGRDRILIEVEGIIALNGQLEVEFSSVDIEGLGPDKTTIQGGGASRLILASSSLTLKNLTLTGGVSSSDGGAIFTSAGLAMDGVRVEGNSAAGAGGAVYLNYNSDERRSVLLRNVDFISNTAGTNGGALSMIGQNQRHDVRVESSSFISNVAAGAGGALDINLPRGGLLRVSNSTFFENDASQGAAIDLQQLDSSVTAYIMNGTFVNTAVGAPGAIYLGNSAGAVHLSHTIYSGSGECGDLGGTQFSEVYYNVFSDAIPASCEPANAQFSVGNAVASQADIESVLNGLTQEGGSTPEEGAKYRAIHFPISLLESSNPAYPVIVDAGNPDDLALSDINPRLCRSVDLRGASRLSGGRCDIGAFELQVPTAVDDEATNQRRFERRTRLAVLDNDLVGDDVPSAGDPVPSRMLTGTIDLDVSDALIKSVATHPTEDGLGSFTVSRVPNGSWSMMVSDEPLPEGSYEVTAVVRDLSGANLFNAIQTVIVRAGGATNPDDEQVSFGSQGIRITSIENDDGDAPDDFITSDGLITVSGTSVAENGAEVEVFLDGESVGVTQVLASDAACGVAPDADPYDGSDPLQLKGGAEDDCIVMFDPGPLTCSDVEGGYEQKFSYRFYAHNDEVGVIESASAEVSVRILNVPPRFPGDEATSTPGEAVVFHLDATDPDTLPAPLPIDLTNIRLRQAPKFAAVSLREVEVEGVPESRFLVFGIEGVGAIDEGADAPVPGVDGLGVVVDPLARTVTYRPKSFEQGFNDRFVLVVEDECGDETAAEFRVRYPGSGVGGSFGWGVVLILLPLIRRGRKIA